MIAPDRFSEHYEECLEGVYDCTDHVVINAYFGLGQSAGGFRTWRRRLMGNDDGLDNTHLMRFPRRFSRRVHAWAEKEKIHLRECQRDERKHELAEQYIPEPPFGGIFPVLPHPPTSNATVPCFGYNLAWSGTGPGPDILLSEWMNERPQSQLKHIVNGDPGLYPPDRAVVGSLRLLEGMRTLSVCRFSRGSCSILPCVNRVGTRGQWFLSEQVRVGGVHVGIAGEDE